MSYYSKTIEELVAELNSQNPNRYSRLPGNPVKLPGIPVELPGIPIKLPGIPVELPGNPPRRPDRGQDMSEIVETIQEEYGLSMFESFQLAFSGEASRKLLKEEKNPRTFNITSYVLDSRTKKNISKLTWYMQERAISHMYGINRNLMARKMKHCVKIVQSLRTIQEQNSIPSENTKAAGLRSFHLWGLAYDVLVFALPEDKNGEILFDIEKATEPISYEKAVETYKLTAEYGKCHHLDWGGDFAKLFDPGHFQIPLSDLNQTENKKYQRSHKPLQFLYKKEWLYNAGVLCGTSFH